MSIDVPASAEMHSSIDVPASADAGDVFVSIDVPAPAEMCSCLLICLILPMPLT